MDETKYFLWLSLILGAGSRVAVRLIRATGSAKAVYDDLSEELRAEARVRSDIMEKLRCRRDLSEAEEIIAWCEKKNVRIITPDMDEYPKSLLCLMDYPMVLFCAGVLPDLNRRFCCAAVGTRKMTEYGKKTAYDIGWGLGDGGAVVVSGLALGIDGMAMAGAQSAGGTTVGVLGCGIDIVYPHEHKDLFHRTCKNGAVITEYPPGTPPARGNFPVRNRIISGLCQATAVIEADIESGSLITAKHAIFQGRTVFAVPGNIDVENAEGCNMLIGRGATVLTSANDILSRFEFLYPHSVRPARKSPGIGAGIAAALSRIVSAVDPKSKYQGGGSYGGKKKKGIRKAAEPVVASEAAVASETVNGSDILSEQEKAEAAAREKTVQMKHIHVDLLGEAERNMFRLMKPSTPILADELVSMGYTVSEVFSAMTMLELAGAVESGAGGYFIRTCDEDDLLEGDTESLRETAADEELN